MIDIFIPVLGRPDAAEKIVRSIREHTVVDFRILFIATLGDEEQISACVATCEDTLIVTPRDRGDYPYKMNIAYLDSESDWILLASDDLDFMQGWDTEALRMSTRVGDRLNPEGQSHVIATNDLANAMVKRGRFGTHSLIRRSYIETLGASADGPGVLCHEGYDHNFVDREICHLAQHRGVYAFASRSRIRHRHPNWRTAPMDATYSKGLSNFNEDQRLFLERAKLWGSVGVSPGEARVARPRRSTGRTR